MRTLKPSFITLGLLVAAHSGSAYAFLDALKEKADNLTQSVEQLKQTDENTVKRSAEQATRQSVEQSINRSASSQSAAPTVAANSTAQSTSSSATPSLGNGPGKKLTSMTKCAGLSLTNVIVGEKGSYTFQQGFSQEKRDGLVNRKPSKVKNDCILPSIRAHQAIYVEVDTKAYNAMGNSNSWEMQCIKSANPGAGTVKPKSEYPYKVNWLSGKDMMLHCGHSEKHVEACAEGSNNSRSSKYSSRLDARGKTMLSVYGVTSTMAPANGEKLYCQYYHKPSGKSLFAFEYLRTRS